MFLILGGLKDWFCETETSSPVITFLCIHKRVVSDDKYYILSAFCSLSRSTLYGVIFKSDHVMGIVTRTVDYICASAFNHWEFAALLEEVESEYGEIICHSNVRCLCMQVCTATFILFVARGPMTYGQVKAEIYR